MSAGIGSSAPTTLMRISGIDNGWMDYNDDYYYYYCYYYYCYYHASSATVTEMPETDTKLTLN